MDHLKQALLKMRMKHVSPGYAHEEHLQAGDHQPEEDNDVVGDKAPDVSPDQSDMMDQVAGNEEITDGDSSQHKTDLMEAIAAHNDERNPSSLHSKAAHHAKKHLHEMKNKKSY